MITIIFGKPGAGKTAYMAALATEYLNCSARCYDATTECIHAVTALKEQGFDFQQPDRAPVYTNFNLCVQSGYKEYIGSYYVDGFHLGFANDYVEIINVLPGAKIFLSEAQRYYNSRKSKDLPDWVSRYFEEHRHYDLDIYLDVQRPGLIDVNIRDIAGKFVEIEQLTQSADKDGKITGTTFYIKEFDDWKHVESYITSDVQHFTKKVVPFNFNVFDNYQSKSYYRNFLPATDFDYIEHVALENVEQDVKLAKEMYSQTAPPGFYAESKRSKK